MAHGTQSGPWTAAGTSADLIARLGEMDAVFVGIGNNSVRLEWHVKLTAIGARTTNLLHPRSVVSPYCSLGQGIPTTTGAVINVGARIDDAAIINTAATVDHDCYLEAGVHISPGANLAGNVRIGARSWIGLGAVVRNGVTIGADSVVGAGGVVIGPAKNGSILVGNPARPIIRDDHA